MTDIRHHPLSRLLVILLLFILFLSACSSLPKASPSTKIALSAWKGTSTIPNNEIFTMNTDGSGLTDLTNNDASDIYPAYSPDGKQIAFCSDRGGKSELYLMNEDGTNQHRMTDQIADCGNPAWSVPVWSPDGKWIAISSSIDGSYPTGKMDIFVIRSDESHMYNLSNYAANDLGYSWSPDSKKVAFASDRDGNLEVYVVGVDGQDLTRLTYDSATDAQPVWSPDGKRLAFKSNRFGNMEIFIMQADGSNQVQLTSNGSMNTNPAWSPDGKSIFYSSNTDGNVEVYRIEADLSLQKNLTNSKVDDYWFWLSPDGSQLIVSTCLSNCLASQATWSTSIMNSDGSQPEELLKQEASVSWKP